MMRFFRPPNSVQDVSISCLICHKFKCGFHALPRIALMLVEPVLGTSTKMHLCLCEIIQRRHCTLKNLAGITKWSPAWVGSSIGRAAPKAFGVGSGLKHLLVITNWIPAGR